MLGSGFGAMTPTTVTSRRSCIATSLPNKILKTSDSVGGCDFPVDPLDPPPAAPVLWSPTDDTSTVILDTAPDLLSTTTTAPILPPPLASDSIGADFRLYDAGVPSLQLIQIGESATITPLVAVIPLDISGFDRLESVERLLATLHHRAVPPDTRLTAQQRARARRMLQAFDGFRDGATQQSIAQVIFDIGDVSRDEWQASSRRHAIMSLLREARRMIEGGYRKLLRHRRRRG